jgi:hypothetical protein
VHNRTLACIVVCHLYSPEFSVLNELDMKLTILHPALIGKNYFK